MIVIQMMTALVDSRFATIVVSQAGAKMLKVSVMLAHGKMKMFVAVYATQTMTAEMKTLVISVVREVLASMCKVSVTMAHLKPKQKTVFVVTHALQMPIVMIHRAITAKNLIGVKTWLVSVTMVQR